MKTTMKQLTAGTFFALFLLIGSVKAEGTERIASSHENFETTLQVENWMTNETIWNRNTTFILDLVQETETSLQLENWMTSAESWNHSFNFIQESETDLKLENWMTCNNNWNVKSEAELTVENWMMNNVNWN